MARRSWSVRFLRPGQGIVWRRSARNGAAMQPALTALAFQYPEKLPSRCTRFRGTGQNHLASTLWRQARLTGEAEPPRQTVARSGMLRPGYANNRVSESNLSHRLGRRLAHASHASTRNPPQLCLVYLRAGSWFGSECRQRRGHRRFPLSPPRNSNTNECPDVLPR
jgi:hypothetical protein